jgi:hypothetical protein
MIWKLSNASFPDFSKEISFHTGKRLFWKLIISNLAQTAERTPIKKFKSTLAIGGGPHCRHE